MSEPDLDNDVFIVCSCEKTCRKDGRPLLAMLGGEGARCSIWVSPSHVAVVARRLVRKGESLRPAPGTVSELLESRR